MAFLEEIRDKYLPAGAEYSEGKSEQIDGTIRSFISGQKDKAQKSGIAKDRTASDIRFNFYYFDMGTDYETAKQEMTAKGLEFSEWDKALLKRQQKAKMERKGIAPKDMKIYKPLEMEDYRQATASDERVLFILSSHYYNAENETWVHRTNLQVVREEGVEERVNPAESTPATSVPSAAAPATPASAATPTSAVPAPGVATPATPVSVAPVPKVTTPVAVTPSTPAPKVATPPAAVQTTPARVTTPASRIATPAAPARATPVPGGKK